MDTKSRIVADFQFIGYKVDNIKFSVIPSVTILQRREICNEDSFQFKLNIRSPQRLSNSDNEIAYVGGLDIKVRILTTINDKKKVIAKGNFGIAGVFKKIGDMPKAQEEYMVKATIPSILLGYLRSTISSTFANAGFGSFIIPLINISNIVKDTNIQIVDAQGTPVEL
ncbi:preprotein translocase subunit SecB [Sphaerochaeta pleomorpha str. Grapes]|uniref:Preprotein translocase subunit SecB n=1 Tax=Sphaerochaeta pleomorpha (strain ATCC BAA-1885 / DSM 22778 / Grapes) TaxID=158190 RepID=G8QS76_SPHPG|nr:protein-export chaperone SecB [Sphaerochaeta pleomorpha]AEV28937.1 preprotein translocase subunit SecB [Sphaerochaeta pleomorpha str. Grapes]